MKYKIIMAALLFYYWESEPEEQIKPLHGVEKETGAVEVE
jgi:hypothetical protein